MQHTLLKLIFFTTFLLPGGAAYAFSVTANDSFLNAVNPGELHIPGAPKGAANSIAGSTTSPQTSTMTAANAAGCSSSIYASVYVAICNNAVAASQCVYSVITPDNNGQHDLRIIDRIDLYPASASGIYHHREKLVREKSNYDNVNIVWSSTGQDGTAFPDRTYYYLVSAAALQLSDWAQLSH